VRVFSNCEGVALLLNGKLLERRKPDSSRVSSHVKHAPFTFQLNSFEPGTLKAVGYLGGNEVASHERHTPGRADKLSLQFDLSGRHFAADGKDVLFCHANLQDSAGTIVPVGEFPVFFGTHGEAQVVGQNPVATEAGIATALLECANSKPRCTIYALGLIPDGDQTRIVSAAASPDGGKAEDYSIHYTTNGTEPSPTSPKYRQPIQSASRLRAAIVVTGKVVTQTEQVAVPASTRASR
jgi:hypothetical protein